MVRDYCPRSPRLAWGVEGARWTDGHLESEHALRQRSDKSLSVPHQGELGVCALKAGERGADCQAC